MYEVECTTLHRERSFMMKILLIEYPKCSTCKKAKNYLESHDISFDDRHIVEQNPDEKELKQWIKQSGLPIKKFFNTSGMKYRELELKDKLPTMSEDEQIALLATDGMLIKRPFLISKEFVLTGFKEKEWEEALQTLS